MPCRFRKLAPQVLEKGENTKKPGTSFSSFHPKFLIEGGVGPRVKVNKLTPIGFYYIAACLGLHAGRQTAFLCGH